MPWLQLVRIVCHDNEDTFGRDEVYITVRSDSGEMANVEDQVWGPVSMDEGDDEWLDNEVAPRSFNQLCAINLYDQDQGGPDDDDHIGVRGLNPRDADSGDKHLYFEGDGAEYTVTARVTWEKPEWPPS
jgi:hypothetical protein